MNYFKIHDTIILNAKKRNYNPEIHQKHHIIPLHEDPLSIETVPLTVKEHWIIHFLRYKMGFGIGNKFAYVLIKSAKTKYSQHALIELCSMAGKIGGKTTKLKNKGIFSSNYDRSAETKRRWKNGILNKNQFDLSTDTMRARGNLSKKSKKGIHSPEYDRGNTNKKRWKKLSEEEKQRRLKKLQEGLCKSGNRKNFSTTSKEHQRKCASLGGSIVGKIPIWTNGKINKRSHECPGADFRRGYTRKKNMGDQK